MVFCKRFGKAQIPAIAERRAGVRRVLEERINHRRRANQERIQRVGILRTGIIACICGEIRREGASFSRESKAIKQVAAEIISCIIIGGLGVGRVEHRIFGGRRRKCEGWFVIALPSELGWEENWAHGVDGVICPEISAVIDVLGGIRRILYHKLRRNIGQKVLFVAGLCGVIISIIKEIKETNKKPKKNCKLSSLKILP